MARVLVPIDGSRNSQYALRRVVNEFLESAEMEIHLLNVQRPFSRALALLIAASAD